jgi:drug/metabolite transporter superfamily protein YnfA
MFTRPLSSNLWLILILAVTALCWIGSAGIGLANDDYHYLHLLAPIRHVGDAFEAFIRADANPNYWRPISNFTLMLDFLAYGWSGGGYHLTNLVLHLLGTWLVYRTCLDYFKLDRSVSLITTLLFGISAAHDSNLLVVASRGDILVTIFCLLTLLSLERRGIGYDLIALPLFFFALCSKELAVLLIPVAAITPLFRDGKAGWKRALFIASSLSVVALVFFLIRSGFTSPITQTDPMLGEGMRSLGAALRNVLYSIAYIVAPLDLASAAKIISAYRTPAMFIAALIAILVATILWRDRKSIPWRSLLLPVLLFLAFTVVNAQSFERWRLYAPSAGLYASMALVGFSLRRLSKSYRYAVVGLAIAFCGFHIYRTQIEQHSWRRASAFLQATKEQLKPFVMDGEPTLLLTRPAKIGGGSIMKISNVHLLLQARAEAAGLEELSFGSTGRLTQELALAVQVICFGPFDEFSPVDVRELGENAYRISVTRESSTRLLVETAETGSVPRERVLQPGDTLQATSGYAVIEEADGAHAISLIYHSHPTKAQVLYFDGKQINRLKLTMKSK